MISPAKYDNWSLQRGFRGIRIYNACIILQFIVFEHMRTLYAMAAKC